MPKKQWRDWIRDALSNLGGEASYDDIYAELRRIRNERFTAKWKSTFRCIIEEHSSDTDSYREKNEDMFTLSRALAREFGEYTSGIVVVELDEISATSN